MGNKAFFCRYPEDPENCRQALIQAWRKGSLGQHCIIEGLKANWPQCRQVLLEGLKNYNSSRKSTGGKTPAALGQTNDIHQACEEVVLYGYPLKIRAVHNTFLEAYYKLMRSIIWKYGYKDDGMPSTDDIFQEAFMRLHKYLLKERRTMRSLTAYVARVTLNTCINPGFESKESRLADEDQIKEKKGSSVAIVPPKVVEIWEHQDHRLLNSGQGNLTNRIILAQKCIEACSTGRKLSAKKLKAIWQTLKQMSEADVASLHRETIKQIKQSPETNVVDIAAKLINSGLAEPHQVAIVFASGTGIDLNRTYELIRQLCSLSDTAIYARISRIYMVLRPPGMEEKE